MSYWPKLSLLCALVLVLTTSLARASSYDLKYNESGATTWKKIGSGEAAVSKEFMSSRAAVECTLKLDNAATIDATSTVTLIFAVERSHDDVTETVSVFGPVALGAFASAFGDDSWTEQGANYDATKRRVKAVKYVMAGEKKKEVRAVEFSHDKDKKVLKIKATWTVVNLGTNTEPNFDESQLFVLSTEDPNPDFELEVTAILTNPLDTATLVPSTPVEGSKIAKLAKVVGQDEDYDYNWSLNFKGSNKATFATSEE